MNARQYFSGIEMYLRAGYPLIDAADMVCRGDSHKRTASKIYVELLSGAQFSVVCEKYLHMRTHDVSLLRIGEHSGNLIYGLSSIVLLYESRQEMQEKLLAAFFYPVLIMIGSGFLMVGIMYVIFPKIMPIFEQFNIEPPLVTRIMVYISTHLVFIGGLGMGTLCAVAIVSFVILNVRFLRRIAERVLLRIPIVGSCVACAYSYMYLVNVHMVLQGGGTVRDAVRAAPKTRINQFSIATQTVACGVEQGKAISLMIESFPRIFGKDVIGLLLLGERAGSLADCAGKASALRKKHLEQRLLYVQKAAEPILLIIVAAVAGLMCVSILLPLYKITQGIHG